MDRFEDAKLRVKEATDLVAMVEAYLPLKPRGRLLLALCPFHAEKSPSFTVYADSQHYYCFGCGKSGDVFTFLMEREGLSFREAMETLADRAHISLEGVFGHGATTAQRGPDPFQVLGEVRTFLQQQLREDGGKEARTYLQSRGLDAAIDDWSLGFHPAPGALARFCASRRLPPSVLEAAGLLRSGREPFAGRLMFPIEDERGRVCGFGGRVLPSTPARSDGSEAPKYVNSPESAFFNKRRVLYGLHRCKQAGSRSLVVMEGYTDVIACHLAGFAGAVAALGTAFTAEHSQKLERYAQEGVVLLFDGDRAGLQAAERATRELVNSRLTIRIALMADAKDPADYVVAAHGEDPELVTERRARFADLLEGADPWLVAWFRLLRRRHDFADAGQLEAAARECGALLRLVDSDLRRQALLAEMARHLAVPAAQLERMLRAEHKQRRAATATPAESDAAVAALPRGPLPPAIAAEHEVLAAVIQEPTLVARLDGTPLQSAMIVRLLDLVRRAVAAGRTARADVVRHVFAACADDADLGSVLAAAIARADEVRDPAAFLEMLQRDRLRQLARSTTRTLRQQLQDALAGGDRDAADRLTRELVEQMRTSQPRATSS